MGRLQPGCAANKFWMALLSINGHVSMMCIKPELSPLCIFTTPPWWFLVFVHEIDHQKIQTPTPLNVTPRAEGAVISIMMWTAQEWCSRYPRCFFCLFSTCLTKLWGLQGLRAFGEAKKYFTMTDQFIALKFAVRGPSHIITPGTSFGMNIDPKWSLRERQHPIAQPSRRLSSSPLATFLETGLSAYRALL